MMLKFVAYFLNMRTSDRKSEKRHEKLVIPRQIAIYFCREHAKASYPEIGEKFGGKDHSTIIHSVKKITNHISIDFELRNNIETIRRGLLD